ncbi:MAG: hypothetical protein JST30_16405 [Armatimonadetes bacterium]|nr:hypothetical protein [Armatimonadota bacterium]
MKWLKALLGLAVIGGFLYVVFVVMKKEGTDLGLGGALPGKPVEASAGTEVPLILLTPLDSGGSEVGRTVKFVVSEDVVKDGVTVVPQGSIATAKVTKSRSGTLAGTLTNTPARLEAEFGSVTLEDGRTVRLNATPEGPLLKFDASNTRMDEPVNVVDIASDPQARDLVVQSAVNMAQGKKLSDDEARRTDGQWRDLAGKYGLKETRAYMEAQKSEDASHDLSGLIGSIQKGDLKGLSASEVLLGAKAAGEILELGSGIDKSLRGIFKGSNIHARTGLRLKAFLAESVKVKPKARKV